MNLRYLSLRLLRHYTPEALARFLLKRRWIIMPGLESSDPKAAADRYLDAIAKRNRSISGKRVLVFGYGGRLAIAIELLQRGASHVVLSDHFVAMDDERNSQLLPENAKYLEVADGRVSPRAEFITLLHGDIGTPETRARAAEVDCVLSNSVYEHIEDVDGITAALARLTSPDGFHQHFVDLRDHYFKYPFEMLTFSRQIWLEYLNPSSNLNRLRLRDYQRVFGRNFAMVEIEVLERLQLQFLDVRERVRPEFLSGELDADSVSLIQVFATQPRR